MSNNRSEASNNKYKPLNAPGNLVGMYLRQIGKSIAPSSDKENASSSSYSESEFKSKPTSLRRTKISPTQESASKNAFVTDESESIIGDASPKRKPKPKASIQQRKNSRRKNKKKVKSSESNVMTEPSREEENTIEHQSNEQEPYSYNKSERKDSFGSDSAIGTMKSDFFSDIDLSKIREGSSAILQELCRTPEQCSPASPFERENL